MGNDRFERVWRGYRIDAVEADIERLETMIQSLRNLVGKMPLAASPMVIETPDPEGEIQAARWEAEKIRLDAQADAHDIVQTAKFRRDMILRTAEEHAKTLLEEARQSIADADVEAPRQLIIDLRPRTAEAG